MSYQGQYSAGAVAGLAVEERSKFIVRTYTHLLSAIAAFTLLEIFFFQSGLARTIAEALLGVNWLFVLGGFIVVSWLASRFAHTARGMAVQYLALAAFVLAEAIIFVPLLFVANYYAPGAISSAAGVTVLGFGGLTAVVFVTRKDFSFLRSALMWGGVLALVVIVAGVLFGFHLGTFFSIAMIGLAGGSILYDTSNVLHHFPEDRYVGAALELFASVALLFWYVLQLFLSRD
jgi:FtsH-binding integral membrane protein